MYHIYFRERRDRQKVTGVSYVLREIQLYDVLSLYRLETTKKTHVIYSSYIFYIFIYLGYHFFINRTKDFFLDAFDLKFTPKTNHN